MSLIMRKFTKALDENGIKYYHRYTDPDVVTDKNPHDIWDVCGYPGWNSVRINIDNIPVELAIDIVCLIDKYRREHGGIPEYAEYK